MQLKYKSAMNPMTLSIEENLELLNISKIVLLNNSFQNQKSFFQSKFCNSKFSLIKNNKLFLHNETCLAEINLSLMTMEVHQDLLKCGYNSKLYFQEDFDSLVILTLFETKLEIILFNYVQKKEIDKKNILLEVNHGLVLDEMGCELVQHRNLKLKFKGGEKIISLQNRKDILWKEVGAKVTTDDYDSGLLSSLRLVTKRNQELQVNVYLTKER